jgi:hypothetical protein
MKYTIDRFEDKYAVVELENKQFVDIPRSAIPSEAKEGDIINVQVDKEATNKQKKHIENLMNDVWAD